MEKVQKTKEFAKKWIEDGKPCVYRYGWAYRGAMCRKLSKEDSLKKLPNYSFGNDFYILDFIEINGNTCLEFNELTENDMWLLANNNFIRYNIISMDRNQKHVLFIDLDDTIIKTVTGKMFPVDVTDFKIRKEVLDKIVDLFPNLNYVEIVSNQGGIPGFVDESDFRAKIKAIESFVQAYLRNHTTRNIFVNSMYCTSMMDVAYRKPNTGMLSSYCRWDKENLIMIGDASGKEGDFSDSDIMCARNFGIDYIDVRDFLKMK